MSLQNDKPNFLDRSTIIALLVVMSFWVAWSKFMEVKYPTAKVAGVTASPSPIPGAAAVVATGTPAPGVAIGSAAPVAGAANGANPSAPLAETFQTFTDARWSFQVSSNGMGLKDIDLKEFQTRDNHPILLSHVDNNYAFATRLVDSAEPLRFAIDKVGENTFVGHATSGNLQIEKTLTVHPENYTIATEIKVSNAATGFKGLETSITDEVPETVKGGFFSRSYETQDLYAAGENNNQRTTITREKGVTSQEANVEVMALSSHYFTMAIVDHSDVIPSFQVKMPSAATVVSADLKYQPATANDNVKLSYLAYAGPKQYTGLDAIDPRLAKVIDYGFFAIIARPLLQLMRFLFSIFGNWGVAIIVMTILVRLVVLPFNIFSTRSMKAMQKIQPEMNRIKERYKDKPAEQKIQMNQEIMELMKRNKANPVGGCLPMLLQLPVFFALYRVLGQSIELYRAPFMFWIHDLSAKDPLYILPVLMGLSMFGQQKLTPTTMDPQQAKIMMWMPVLFSFFMISLPSGLTLYIFVSTLFAIVQQFVLMRDKPLANSVKVAKA